MPGCLEFSYLAPLTMTLQGGQLLRGEVVQQMAYDEFGRVILDTSPGPASYPAGGMR